MADDLGQPGLRRWLSPGVAPVLARFSTDRAALLGTFAFLCTNAMLDYTRSGSSYVPALAALNVSLFLICRCPEQPNDQTPLAWLAGISMAASILFWFPFILAVPAVGLFIVVVSRGLPRPRRVRLFFTIFAACGIAVILIYGAAIHARGIRSFPALKSWVDASRNEWAQTDRVKRAISGVPRSVLDLGDDTLAVKRYVYRDPYAPVTVSQLLRAGMAKLLLFYLYVAAILLVLSRGPDGRTVLKLLITSAVPTLVFAVALFEPGSTERYLPVYPFFFLAAALALGSVKPPSTPVRLFMGAFLVVVLCAGNLYAKLSFRGAAAFDSMPVYAVARPLKDAGELVVGRQLPSLAAILINVAKRRSEL